MASALFEVQRNSTEAVAVWCVMLHFPTFINPFTTETVAEKDFYWATGPGIELEDGNIYTQQLTEVPRGRHQSGRGNDFAEFNASNVDYALYQELLPYQDLIEKAEVTIRKAYEVSKDFWESEIMFVGYLKDFTLDDTDKTFKFTCISDMSRSNFWVGNRILTREKCGTEFNFNGTNDPTYHLCGWQVEQGGNPLYCSKLLDGVDGCNSHNNSHRFYAVPALSTADVTIISDPGDGGGWDGGGGPPCFSEKMFVVMSDWTVKPICDVEIGQNVLGFDLFDNDKLIEAEVLNTQKTLVDEIWTASFDTGLAVIEVMKNHLFYLGNRTFTPVACLGERPAIGLAISRKPAQSHLTSIERSIEKLCVFNLHTASNNYVICDSDARFFYMVHNTKVRDPILLFN